MNLRRTCIGCGSTRRRAYWADATRAAVLARCLDCGENFNGPGIFLPPEWATSSARGLTVEVDPKAEGAVAA